VYGYDDLLRDEIELLDLGYTVEYIGRTVYGRRIPAFVRGEASILVTGGTHARESITSRLVVDLAREYEGDRICFLPLLNIDGAEIVKRGMSSVPKPYKPLVKQLSKGNDLRLWKANGRGVDINVNYDADWGQGRSNVFVPFYENFVGECPESEPETKASVELVKKYRFDTLVSYHSKGEVIYAGYGGVNNPFHADMLTKLTGYPHEEAKGSSGGFKDWFIKEGYGDGYTIEVGRDELSHPLTKKDYPEIYQKNKGICALLESKEWILTKNL
jgi:g-D-glutamyl-meso-diaminopimelate peptidase